MSIPKNITREHLIQAIEKINHDGIPKDGDSMYYDVKYNSKFYPPKLVVSIANLFANGIELDRNSFDGGMNSPCFDLLINNGFEILTKELEEITSAIELKKYFRHFRDNDLLLNFFDFTKGVLSNCNLSETDKRIAFTLRKNGKQISINLGRKLIIAIYKSNNDNFFCFHLLENDVPWAKELPGYLKEEIFKINPPARLLYFKASLELINNKELLEKIKAGIMEWLPSVESAGQAERHNRLIYRLINDIDMRNDFFSTSSNSLLPEILEAIESESFQNFIHEDEFYFEKAKNAFDEFKSLQLSDKSILEKIEQDFKVAGKFKDYYKGLNQDSEEYTITNSIAKLISYCDSNAAFKNELNETRDKRVLAKAGVRQNNWFENLIKFKREENYTELPSSIKNALIYLENPNQGITMLSDNHREKFIKAFVPSKQFTSENFIDDILAFFKPYEIRCKNELNYTRALSAILYNYQPVRNLWLDIVEENDQNLNLNYWVFQGNPKIYDFVEARNKGAIDQWTATAHRDKMKIGDKVIFWLTGPEAGCYALGEITSEPFENKEKQDEFWKKEDKTEWKVGVKVTHDFIDKPLLREQLASIKELSELKVGNQGTNFVATKEEYDKILEFLKNKTAMKYWLYAPGENANMWDEFYEKGIMGLGWDELGDLNEYANKQEISLKLQEIHNTDSSKANDSTANYDFKENVSIGDMIIAKKGRNAYLGYGYVTSDYYYDQSAESYKHRRKVRWEKYGHWDTNHSIVLKTLTDITNVKSKSNPSLMAPEAILNIINGIQSDKKNQMPINQILYGPPGTGKTYELKSHYFPKYSSQESSISAEQHFKNVVSECSWWQVLAVALIQMGKCKVNELANHKWVVQKAMLSNSNTIRATMWGQLQSHTVDNCEFVNVKSKQQPFIFNKTKDSHWEIVEEELKEKAPEIYELIDSVEKFSPRADKKFDRYFFTTFHQSYSYEDFIEGIKPVLENEESDGSVAYRIEDGIFKQICKKAEIDPENQYAIFIDEINRGNISAIFGELITLIEQDKRKGAANEMTVILPYSKNPFSVPKNLDIIGTMNTADRSVEALDTALRRRFSFVEMLPKPELLKDKGENNSGEIEGIDLFSLLTIINERIEVLVDRDHTIGHAFFINDTTIEDLRNTFANKIIPLLQEYFYGDYSKMELVIGSAFFDKKEVSKVKFAVKSEDFEAEGQVYHIKNISDTSVMSDKDFITALEILIKGEA
jgi:hypothetical protein